MLRESYHAFHIHEHAGNDLTLARNISAKTRASEANISPCMEECRHLGVFFPLLRNGLLCFGAVQLITAKQGRENQGHSLSHSCACASSSSSVVVVGRKKCKLNEGERVYAGKWMHSLCSNAPGSWKEPSRRVAREA